VPILANTTYVASYHAPNGFYAFDGSYFQNGGVDSPPLHAVQSNNGVFKYGASAFPDETFQASNYWVDVVLCY
jgi:hypothetical protein